MQRGKHDEQASAPLDRSSQEERAARKNEAGIVRCDCCGAVIPGYRFNVRFECNESLSCMVCGYSNRFYALGKSASRPGANDDLQSLRRSRREPTMSNRKTNQHDAMICLEIVFLAAFVFVRIGIRHHHNVELACKMLVCVLTQSRRADVRRRPMTPRRVNLPEKQI